MFEGFFYRLHGLGVPVTPTSFLRLQNALTQGLVVTLDDFYVVARSLLIKRTRNFDLYDKVFAHYFKGKEFDENFAATLAAEMRDLLRDWLDDPQMFPELTAEERAALKAMTPDELEKYFRDRLAEQTERHDGGNRWIGTGGTSPVGHSGYHPGGMRVGGESSGHSAIKVALERRYIDYADKTTLSAHQLGEALRALKDLAPVGPKDQLNVDKTIYETVRNAGEIEMVFDRRLRDKLNVFLFIDNGGWSMTPYVNTTRALFYQAQSAFKKMRTFFFHNCIYSHVWEDPQRVYKPIKLAELVREDPDTRVIILGDAAMAPYELIHSAGAIDRYTRQYKSGLQHLADIFEAFPHSVWINPIPADRWSYTDGAQTIGMIAEIFPMVDLTLGGIEKAVEILLGN